MHVERTAPMEVVVVVPVRGPVLFCVLFTFVLLTFVLFVFVLFIFTAPVVVIGPMAVRLERSPLAEWPADQALCLGQRDHAGIAGEGVDRTGERSLQ